LFELNSSDLVALLLGSLAGKPAAGVGVVPQGESGAAGEFAAELLPLLAGEAEAGGPQGAQLQPPRASAQAAVGDWRTLLHSIPADSAQAGQALAKAAVAVEEGPTLTLRERLLLLLEQPELHSAAGKGAPAQRDVESLPPPPDKLPSALLQLLATSLASALEPAAAGELPSVQLLAAVNARLKAAWFRSGRRGRTPRCLWHRLWRALRVPPHRRRRCRAERRCQAACCQCRRRGLRPGRWCRWWKARGASSSCGPPRLQQRLPSPWLQPPLRRWKYRWRW